MAHVDPVAPKERRPKGPRVRPNRLGAALAWVGTLLTCVLIILAVSWTGLSLNFVLSGSMEPAYRYHDLALAVSPKLVPPEVGAVAIVHPQLLGQELDERMHRIVAVTPDGSWITKGDANPEKDPGVIPPDRVRAVVIGKVPTRWLQDQKWAIGVIFGLLFLILLWPRRKDLEVKLASIAIADSAPTAVTLQVKANAELVKLAQWSFDISEDPNLTPVATRTITAQTISVNDTSGDATDAVAGVTADGLTPATRYYTRARAVVEEYEVMSKVWSFKTPADPTGPANPTVSDPEAQPAHPGPVAFAPPGGTTLRLSNFISPLMRSAYS